MITGAVYVTVYGRTPEEIEVQLGEAAIAIGYAEDEVEFEAYLDKFELLPRWSDFLYGNSLAKLTYRVYFL